MSPFDQDVKSNEFWVQGVIPTVIGVTATLIGFLYMFGVICSGKRRGGVAPTTTNTAATNSDAGSRSRDVDFLDPRISVAEATVKYGPVATEAKLWGMTQAERRQVLEAVFSKLDKKALAKTDKEHTQDESSPTLEEDCLERGDCGVDSNSKHFNNSPGEPSEHSALDMRLSCAICLREYEKGDDLLNGTSCSHKWHWECAMIWLTKHKKPKDHCPYCRELMFNPDEMKSAALEVLGKERVHELVANERSENKDAVDLTANNTDGTVDESSSANSNHRVMTTQIASRNDNAANNTHNSTDELELEV